MRNKRVVHVSKYYSPYFGGIESVVADLAEGSKEFIDDVNVIAIDNEDFQKFETINGVNVIRSKQNFIFLSQPVSMAYVYEIFKCDADILHVHLPNPLANFSIFIRSLFRRNDLKIILHWHSDIVKQKKVLFFYKPLLNWLLDKCDRVIVTSKVYLDSSEQLVNHKSKCQVIPIGIDNVIDRVDFEKVKSIRERYENKKIVFTLGRHIYYKGFEFLIESAKSVPDTVFLVGGSGPDTEKYKKIISDNQLQDRVLLLGRIPQDMIANYFSAADVFCFPSTEKSEAFGVVQLESMSVGTPVISTNIVGSGVPWVNKDSLSGLVCAPKSSAQLSLALNRILFNEDLLLSLGQGALKRYNDLFRKDKMVEDCIVLYKKII